VFSIIILIVQQNYFSDQYLAKNFRSLSKTILSAYVICIGQILILFAILSLQCVWYELKDVYIISNWDLVANRIWGIAIARAEFVAVANVG